MANWEVQYFLHNNFYSLKISEKWDFPGGPVVKNQPSKAGDAGSIPGQGTKIPQAAGQLNPRTLETMCFN